MNKKIYTLVAILLSLLVINVVRAEEIYSKDFETNLTRNKEAESHFEYKDGYLLLDEDDNTEICTLKYYNYKGELIKSVDFDYLYNLNVSGNDIYAYVEEYNEDDDSWSRSIAKINSELAIVASDPVPYIDELSDDNVNDIVLDYRYYTYGSEIKVDSDKVLIFNYNGVVSTYSRDLKNKTTHDMTRAELNKYFPEVKQIKTVEGLNAQTKRYMFLDSKTGYILSEVEEIKASCMDKSIQGPSFIDCISYKVVLLDEQLNVKWEKTLPESTIPIEARFVNDHVIVIEDELKRENGDSYLAVENKMVIYDMNGNKLQELESEYGFHNIVPTSHGFLVNQDTCGISMVKGAAIWFGGPDVIQQEKGPIDTILEKSTLKAAPYCQSNHQVYTVPLKIESKVTKGKGTIEVIKSSKPGEPVTFVVKPQEGYVLGEVRVTDANGKTIVFKDYTFTMPNADVLVEAEFLPANPETKDLAITIILLIAIFAGMFGFVQFRKTKEIS